MFELREIIELAALRKACESASDAQLKVLNEEFDRMMELSPPISQRVVAQFHAEFSDQPGYSSVIKPDICGQLQSIANFCHEEEIDLQFIDQDIDPAQDVREEFRRVRGRSPSHAELTVLTTMGE